MVKTGIEEISSGEASPQSGRQRGSRRRHSRHGLKQHLQRRTGKEMEVAGVTLLALAILFFFLYLLLSRDERRFGSEESRLMPPPGAPLLFGLS